MHQLRCWDSWDYEYIGFLKSDLSHKPNLFEQTTAAPAILNCSAEFGRRKLPMSAAGIRFPTRTDHEVQPPAAGGCILLVPRAEAACFYHLFVCTVRSSLQPIRAECLLVVTNKRRVSASCNQSALSGGTRWFPVRSVHGPRSWNAGIGGASGNTARVKNTLPLHSYTSCASAKSLYWPLRFYDCNALPRRIYFRTGCLSCGRWSFIRRPVGGGVETPPPES